MVSAVSSCVASAQTVSTTNCLLSAKLAAGSQAPASPVSAQPVALHSNPVPSIDPELSIVVLRFFNDAGAQTQSIPTQRQIELYRLHLDAAAEAAGELGP